MNKNILLVVIILLLLSAVFFAKNKVGDIRPSTMPSDTIKEVIQNQKQGRPVNFPLTVAAGFHIGIFADSVAGARDEQFSPGGTLLVSKPASGQVVAIPDKNNDGIADEVKVIVSGENQPHGLAFYNGKLYVADVDKVVRFNWDESTLTATKDKVLFSLPSNNDHNKRTIIFDDSGKMFVSVGSTCNVCNEKSNLSATIITSDADGNSPTVFAKGLRNAPFMQLNPSTHELWSTEMGRDFLGDNLPPDEIDIIKQGNDYGWPNCYADKIPDTNFNRQASCENTTAPIFQIPAHSAPLGLTFIESSQFPADLQGDLLVSEHGSWNRSTPIGYKVVKLNVEGNTITSSEDFITGFLEGTEAVGRPVDVTFGPDENLYVSDDKAGVVYIVIKSQ